MSMLINTRSGRLGDFIQILEPPASIHGDASVVYLEYRCTDERYIGFEVITNIGDDMRSPLVKVFQKTFKCYKNVDSSHTKVKRIRVKLPPNVGYNVNAFNTNVSLTSNTRLRAWIVESDWWPHCRRQRNCYTRASVKVAYDTSIPPPFSRPYFRVPKTCTSFGWMLLFYATSYRVPTCPFEQGNRIVYI